MSSFYAETEYQMWSFRRDQQQHGEMHGTARRPWQLLQLGKSGTLERGKVRKRVAMALVVLVELFTFRSCEAALTSCKRVTAISRAWRGKVFLIEHLIGVGRPATIRRCERCHLLAVG